VNEHEVKLGGLMQTDIWIAALDLRRKRDCRSYIKCYNEGRTRSSVSLDESPE
jgi:hypothetical protein